MNTDRTFYEAALLGLEKRQADIESRIEETRVELGRFTNDWPAKGKGDETLANMRYREYHGKRARTRTRKATHRNPHRISAAGRKHIAEATRKRWAAYRKAHKAKGKKHA